MTHLPSPACAHALLPRSSVSRTCHPRIQPPIHPPTHTRTRLLTHLPARAPPTRLPTATRPVYMVCKHAAKPASTHTSPLHVNCSSTCPIAARNPGQSITCWRPAKSTKSRRVAKAQTLASFLPPPVFRATKVAREVERHCDPGRAVAARTSRYLKRDRLNK